MNKNKTTPFIIGIIVISVVVIFVLIQRSSKKEMPYSNGQSTSAPSENTNPTASTLATGTSTGGKEYTLADVATHKSKSDCWTTINGGVYNLTSWISVHPGGEEAILSLCGIDGSEAFNGQHGGQRRPEAELARLKVGTLKK